MFKCYLCLRSNKSITLQCPSHDTHMFGTTNAEKYCANIQINISYNIYTLWITIRKDNYHSKKLLHAQMLIASNDLIRKGFHIHQLNNKNCCSSSSSTVINNCTDESYLAENLIGNCFHNCMSIYTMFLISMLNWFLFTSLLFTMFTLLIYNAITYKS